LDRSSLGRCRRARRSDAALVVAKSGLPLNIAAEEYGVSMDMMRYRVNATGAKRQADASRTRRRSA
jgi:hypothetical protein